MKARLAKVQAVVQTVTISGGLCGFLSLLSWTVLPAPWLRHHLRRCPLWLSHPRLRLCHTLSSRQPSSNAVRPSKDRAASARYKKTTMCSSTTISASVDPSPTLMKLLPLKRPYLDRPRGMIMSTGRGNLSESTHLTYPWRIQRVPRHHLQSRDWKDHFPQISQVFQRE